MPKNYSSLVTLAVSGQSVTEFLHDVEALITTVTACITVVIHSISEYQCTDWRCGMAILPIRPKNLLTMAMALWQSEEEGRITPLHIVQRFVYCFVKICWKLSSRSYDTVSCSDLLKNKERNLCRTYSPLGSQVMFAILCSVLLISNCNRNGMPIFYLIGVHLNKISISRL